MALTAYCKKCDREVAPGEICPRCGTKLAKTAVHAAWTVERRPIGDWMCWNAVMRWLLPGAGAVLLLALILEGIAGGPEAVERLFLGSFFVTVAALFLAAVGIVGIVLMIQGRELMDYVIDSRGVHVTRYLPNPTALKLIARGKSPSRMREATPGAESPVVRLEERDLPWRQVARVQLWPEKCYILFYAPAWWLRIPVRATPFSWEDALFFVKDKLGKKKAVDLPAHLRTQPAKKAPSPRRSARRTAPEPVPALAPDFRDISAPDFPDLPSPNSPDLSGPDFPDLPSPTSPPLSSPDFPDLPSPEEEMELPETMVPAEEGVQLSFEDQIS